MDLGGSAEALGSEPRFSNPAAFEAVWQWQDSPLILNGEPHAFVPTVTLTFAGRRPPDTFIATEIGALVGDSA